MATDQNKQASPKVPLVLKKPPKPIGEMSDEERRAFAGEIVDAIDKAFVPTDSTPSKGATGT